MPQSQRLDQISDALSYGCPSSPTLLTAGFDGVLALDTWNGWSAAFCMRISADGPWSSDIHFVRRDDSGAWEDCASGGAHGLTWPSDGWRPTVEGNGFRPGHQQGFTVPDDDGEEFLLAGVAGYAGSGVRTIRVEAHGEEQTATVQPQLSAFVIVRPVGMWTLTPLDVDSEPVGEPLLIEPFT